MQPSRDDLFSSSDENASAGESSVFVLAILSRERNYKILYSPVDYNTHNRRLRKIDYNTMSRPMLSKTVTAEDVRLDAVGAVLRILILIWQIHSESNQWWPCVSLARKRSRVFLKAEKVAYQGSIFILHFLYNFIE